MSATALATVNAAIARLSFMTNGRIGRDWRSGRPFVAFDKGSEWDALNQALEALRLARGELEQHRNGAGQSGGDASQVGLDWTMSDGCRCQIEAIEANARSARAAARETFFD